MISEGDKMLSLLEEIKRINAIADVGLLYAANGYEKERYTELKEIALRMLSELSGSSITDLNFVLPLVKDYPTAKVDIRALVINDDGRILMVKESADGRWSLPGGWADIGYSPAETARREVKEETGLDVVVKNLLAVFDKRKHPHPPQPHYVYKLIIECELTGGVIAKGFDVLDVGFFPANDLPELSEDRILQSQIELVFRKITNGDREPHLD